MSFCLILLAGGESKRFNSKIPKPFIKIGGKTLLEHSLIKFDKIKGYVKNMQMKKILIFIFSLGFARAANASIFFRWSIALCLLTPAVRARFLVSFFFVYAGRSSLFLST